MGTIMFTNTVEIQLTFSIFPISPPQDCSPEYIISLGKKNPNAVNLERNGSFLYKPIVIGSTGEKVGSSGRREGEKGGKYNEI